MSSCLRFTADRSLALRVLVSGTARMRCRVSISAMVCSASIRHNIYQKGGEVNPERWENVSFANGRHGTILITSGKTAAARRILPLTPRARAVLESRWNEVGKPAEGWVCPAPTKSGHADHSTVKKQHIRALKPSGVRPFVLYSLRHTFLTRLAESGCYAWSLARIAGWSDVSISKPYLHPSDEAVLAAMTRLRSEVGPVLKEIKVLPN